MERIYFDKQIFSHLFNGTNPMYQELLSNLLANKHNFLYCYSHAHLLDLKNDKTDIKYKELEFMETLVGDNYLSYNLLERRTSCYLAKPAIAFKDINNDDDFLTTNPLKNIFDEIDLSYATQEQREQLTAAKDIFANQKLSGDFSKIQNLPSDIAAPLSKVLPFDMSSMTLMDWTEHLIGLAKAMQEDKAIYKDLRGVVDKHINNGKFTVDYNSIDFNDDLKNSVLQKSFIDFVTNNLNPNSNKAISDYDFFTNAYFTLDLLGISKEPSKSVKFKNVMNDGFHSYYGAFCDYVVSDDLGFLKKTKALYALLKIKTKVLHIDEFILQFKILSNNFESDINIFFDVLSNDLENGFISSTKPSIRYNRQTTTIKPIANYLGYFNKIERITENNKDYVILSRTTHNYSYFCFYKEYEGVTNKAIKLLGIDMYFKGEYNWKIENEEINKQKWPGRYWEIGNLTVLLEINKGTDKLNLQLTTK